MDPKDSDRRDQIVGRVLLRASIFSWCLLYWPIISAGPLVLDEHGSYWIVDSDLPGTLIERSLNYAAIPPLSSWLQLLSLDLLGKSEFAFRLPSALCALGAILVSYFTGKEIKNCLTGGVMALLIAWHPEAMDETRIARCYGLVLLTGATAYWATIRWWRIPSSIVRCSVWSACSVSLLYSHYTSALLVIISGLALAICFLLSGQLNRTVLMRLSLAVVILISFCWPLINPVLRLKDWGPALNYNSAGTSLRSIFGPFWWAGLPTGLLIVRIFGKKNERTAYGTNIFILTLACAVVPLLIFLLMSTGETSSMANPRYRVAYAPFAVGLVAIILTSCTRRFVTVLSVFCFLGAAWYFTGQSPFHLGRLDQRTAFDWKELNDFVQQNSEPGETIFVQSGLTEGYLVPIYFDDRKFMEYVACRVSRFYVDQSHPRYALPFLWNGSTEMRAFYAGLITSDDRSHDSFWVACATDTDLNINSLVGMQEIAEGHGFLPAKIKTWESATLIHYQLKSN